MTSQDRPASSTTVQESSARPAPPGWVLGAVALTLFLIWSNTFIAIGYVLGAESDAARFDWLSLTVARFLPVFPICLGFCLLPKRWPVTRAVVRQHWRRLLACGFLAVPAYNCALYFGQQHGVPAPVASLTTTLAPFFILVFSISFLGERLTLRRGLGFGLCIVGMGVISFARRGASGSAYPLIVAVTALAPLSWSCFSVLTKPVMRTVDPVHWTYLAIVFGSVPVLLLTPWWGLPEMRHLDGTGWAAVLYLALLATVAGFAIWTWLLQHLPASTVGLTIFLNPPLTTISKLILAAALPAAFAFRLRPLEGVGGAIVLTGLAVGVLQRVRR
ncbi:MAG: DMT family transporter [Candidatus Eisenbacteria bacterium]